MNVERPVVRYFGGKWMLAPWIISHFPAHRIYVEPFGGGGSVLLRKPRSYAEVYNDLNASIVGLFKVLRDPDQAAELRRRLYLTPFAREEFKEAAEGSEDPIEEARRVVIRSHMGFGADSVANRRKMTGFRANNRLGTAPAQDWANYPDILPAVIERLRGITIENRKAIEVILQHDTPETLHYLDPPYPHSTRGQGQSHNYAHEMTDADHEELARLLKGGAIKGFVVLSSYAHPIYDALEWKTVMKKALADGARERQEILYLCPRTAAQLKQQEIFD